MTGALTTRQWWTSALGAALLAHVCSGLFGFEGHRLFSDTLVWWQAAIHVGVLVAGVLLLQRYFRWQNLKAQRAGSDTAARERLSSD